MDLHTFIGIKVLRRMARRDGMSLEGEGRCIGHWHARGVRPEMEFRRILE